MACLWCDEHVGRGSMHVGARVGRGSMRVGACVGKGSMHVGALGLLQAHTASHEK
jgi:hypothetical protein